MHLRSAKNGFYFKFKLLPENDLDQSSISPDEGVYCLEIEKIIFNLMIELFSVPWLPHSKGGGADHTYHSICRSRREDDVCSRPPGHCEAEHQTGIL